MTLYVFSDPQYPFDAPSSINLLQAHKDMMDNDFIAIKSGDVTNDARVGLAGAAGTRNSAKATIEVEGSPIFAWSDYIGSVEY